MGAHLASMAEGKVDLVFHVAYVFLNEPSGREKSSSLSATARRMVLCSWLILVTKEFKKYLSCDTD